MNLIKGIGIVLTALVCSLFVGIFIISIGLGAILTDMDKIATPIVCAGGQLQMQATTYHPAPGETVTTEDWFCVNKSGVQQSLNGFELSLIAGIIYGLALFVPVIAVVVIGQLLNRGQRNPEAASNPLGSVGCGVGIGVLIVLGGVVAAVLLTVGFLLPRIDSAAQAATSADASQAAAQSKLPTLFSDQFDSDRGLWSIGPDNSDLFSGTRTITDGALRWKLTANSAFGSFDYPQDVQPRSDVYISADVQITGPSDSDAGLILRHTANDTEWYYFSLNGNGRYSFALYNSGWRDLLPEASSSAVKPGRANKLSVAARGTHFVLLINDQVVAGIDDDTIPRGQSGLGVEMAHANDQGVFVFDNFEIHSAK